VAKIAVYAMKSGYDTEDYENSILPLPSKIIGSKVTTSA
jgi:hypothetical protein